MAGAPMSAGERKHGPFALSGPAETSSASGAPARGDLAHIGLAGTIFVPHYAVPQPRAVMPGGARLLTQPDGSASEICTMMEGDSFEVLDLTGEWAWGCLSLKGPTGYVHIDRLEPLV